MFLSLKLMSTSEVVHVFLDGLYTCIESRRNCRTPDYTAWIIVSRRCLDVVKKTEIFLARLAP